MDNFEKAIKHAEIRKEFINGDRTVTGDYRKGWSDCIEYMENQYTVLLAAEEQIPEMPDGLQCDDCED